MTTTSTTSTTTNPQPAAPPERTTVLPPVNLEKWIEEHRHELKPPVGNKYLYDGDGFFVMIIGGPNARNDFHVTNSEEFFHQLQGDIVVSVIEHGERRDIPVREGETIFIPGGVPHSPQRPPNTVGLVVELRRPEGETEHQQFYCPNCNELVYDKEFDCGDIVEHFARSMEEFWADEKLSTCENCGTRVGKPTPIKAIHTDPEVRVERE